MGRVKHYSEYRALQIQLTKKSYSTAIQTLNLDCPIRKSYLRKPGWNFRDREKSTVAG